MSRGLLITSLLRVFYTSKVGFRGRVRVGGGTLVSAVLEGSKVRGSAVSGGRVSNFYYGAFFIWDSNRDTLWCARSFAFCVPIMKRSVT